MRFSPSLIAFLLIFLNVVGTKKRDEVREKGRKREGFQNNFGNLYFNLDVVVFPTSTPWGVLTASLETWGLGGE